MTRQRCPRAWEIEPAHDGRLSASAKRALQGHVESCAICRIEQTFVESLARALREADAPNEELTARRLRQVVMQRARTARFKHVRWPALAGLGIGVLSVALLSALWLKPYGKRTSAVTIRALSHDAEWTRRVRGDAEYVDVRRGHVAFNVKHHADDLRLIVLVPDGKIEDLGTVFMLNTHAGHTERIVVTEGVIVFRRNHADAVAIRAGEVWRPEENPAVSATAHATPNSAELAATDCHEHDAATTRPGSRPKPRSVLARARLRPKGARLARDELAAASTAAESSTTEDAEYLRLIALSREGRDEEARISARMYLMNFPDGFRRLEAERLAGTR
jgi:hypothetical protein